jgi:hypothetical protein
MCGSANDDTQAFSSRRGRNQDGDRQLRDHHTGKIFGRLPSPLAPQDLV